MGKTTSPRIKSASLAHQKRIASVDMDDGFQANCSAYIPYHRTIRQPRIRHARGSDDSSIRVENRQNILSLSEQPHHIKVVFTLKVEPDQRKTGDTPAAQSRNVE